MNLVLIGTDIIGRCKSQQWILRELIVFYPMISNYNEFLFVKYKTEIQM
jgi:hypothetical protein